ncbi:MAG: ornithine cyclodeaminase [Pseudomonadota bacterium]|nr:ornithine cyclodeaminase [Pseudomonadota bacterium]
MVEYIGIESLQRIVGRLGPAVFMEGLAGRIEADYRRWGEFGKSARHATHSPGGVIELMPISDGQHYAFKYVNGHPGNTARGLPTVMAFGVLAEVQTGAPLLLSELTLTTALRTAAMSALAARWMARPDSRVMALIGNGAQSEFQAMAFHHMLGIRDLRLYDLDPLATARLMTNLENAGLRDLRITPCRSVAEAVRGADIVTTATADKRHAPVLTPGMIAPGMHLNALGGDCPGKTELHPDILRRPDARVIVEYEPQSRLEGEIQQLPADFAVTEFAQVVSTAAPGRACTQEVTIFDSVGFALEDYSALRYLYQLQQQQSRRQTIDLIPELGDPKNLFGLLQTGGARPVPEPSATMTPVNRPLDAELSTT